MTKLLLLVTGVLLSLSIHIVPAEAQLARTFVSSLGNDNNDCGRLTPCRTFQRAHDATLSLGEITVLDPGGYGAVNITKGISIINDGVGEAGVLVSGGLIGITVNAGAGDRVTLRGLTVKGIGFGGGNGIRLVTAGSLILENCIVRNHTGDGIQMFGPVPAGVTTTFILSNTVVTDNGGNGIYMQPSGTGKLKVVLNRVELYNNSAHGFGLALVNSQAGAAATVLDSVAANNGLAGFSASTVGNNEAFIYARRAVSTHNQYGFWSDFSGIRLADTTTFGNTEAWHTTNSGAITSYGGNVTGETGVPGQH